MQRPAIVNLARGVDRRMIGFGLVALTTFSLGYLGQGSWGVGAGIPSEVSAIVTDVVGGAGGGKPVRIKISMAVTNNGTDAVRVLEPDVSGNGADILYLSPSDLLVEPGMIGRIDAEATLDCDLPELLQLPDLRLELRDGVRRGLHVGGSGMVLQACSRAEPEVHPLAATTPTPKTPSDDGRLAVRFSSPTGRRTDVLAVRAGGAVVPMSPARVTVTGTASVDVRLTAPRTCPVQWQVSGVPTALTVDLLPGPAPARTPGRSGQSGTTVRIGFGPALASWLLATSCPAVP